MTLKAMVLNLGSMSVGNNATMTFTFAQNGTATDPAGGAVLKMTPPGGVKTDYSASLVHGGAGVYTYAFNPTSPTGFWTGTIYAPAGNGQAAQDFQIQLENSSNWG